MVAEVILNLHCRPVGAYLDCTVGGGGHSEAILEASGPDGILIGMDRDGEALRQAEARLSKYGNRARFFHGVFSDLGKALKDQKIPEVDGILMDLGVSTMQLMDPSRGFSFQNDGPLDMRMDQRSGVPASDLVNTLPEYQLMRLLSEWGEERWAKRIARAIARRRLSQPIMTTFQLAEIIRKAIPRSAQPRRLHPATKTFQALRIAVNRELDDLAEDLQQALAFLKLNGRLCVIAFHSLEDRIVKGVFRTFSRSDPREFHLVTKKPLVADRSEVLENPRSRSAKLRVIERITNGPHRSLQGLA